MSSEDPQNAGRYKPADPRTQEEVGGVLERAFEHERGHEPLEEQARRLLQWADEAEERAVAAESLANQAEQAAARAAERYALTGDQDDLAALRRWEAEAEAARREAEATREEVERLHKYLP